MKYYLMSTSSFGPINNVKEEKLNSMCDIELSDLLQASEEILCFDTKELAQGALLLANKIDNKFTLSYILSEKLYNRSREYFNDCMAEDMEMYEAELAMLEYDLIDCDSNNFEV